MRAEADAAEAAGDTETAEALREEADAEAAEDTEATETQLANLNRDPDAVIEVTSEKTEGFELYVSDTAVRAVAKTVEKALEPGGFVDKYLLGRELSADAKEEIRDTLDALGKVAHFAGCTTKQGRVNWYNPLNWFVSPAYAAEQECGIVMPNGTFKTIPSETYAECKDAIYAYLKSLPSGERNAVLERAGIAVGEQRDPMLGGELNAWLRAAIAKLDEDGLVAFQQGYDLGFIERLERETTEKQKVAEIVNDPDLSIAEKLHAYQKETGHDLITEIAMGIVMGGKAGVVISKARFGHTFKRHGAQSTEFLTNRARASGQPQGQFLDDQAAAKFIQENLSLAKTGAVSIPIPNGFPARIVNPDGTFSTARTIRLVPGGKGVKTAYPEP